MEVKSENTVNKAKAEDQNGLMRLEASHKQITDWVNNYIFVQQMGYPSYNAQLVLPFKKPNNVFLKSTIWGLLKRHQLLRSALVLEGQQLIQHVFPEDSLEVQIPFTDISSDSDSKSRFAELLDKEMKHRFDYKIPGWFKILLVKIAEEEFNLIITLDHLLFDLSFLNQFEQEFIQLYKNCIRNSHVELKPVQQYREFSEYERHWFEATEGREAKRFWSDFASSQRADYEITHQFSLRKNFRTAKSYAESISDDLLHEVPQIPPEVVELAKGHILTIKPCNSAGYQISLDAKDSMALRKTAVRSKTSFYKLLQTALAILLAKKSAKERIYLIGVTSLRSEKRFANLAGCLTRLIMYQVTLEKEKTLRELILCADQQLKESEKHAFYPFERVIRDQGIPYDSLGLPMINYIYSNEEQEPCSVGHRDFGFATFPISMEISGAFNSTNFICNYQTNWFSKEIIEDLMCEFMTLLRELPDKLDHQLQNILNGN